MVEPLTNDEEIALLRDMIADAISWFEDDNRNGKAEDLTARLEAIDVWLNYDCMPIRFSPMTTI
jgi:hypothetical protein